MSGSGENVNKVSVKERIAALKAKEAEKQVPHTQKTSPVQSAAAPKQVSTPINPVKQATKTPQGPTPEQDHVKAATTQTRMLLSKNREQQRENMKARFEQDKLYAKPTTTGNVIIRPSTGDKDLYTLYIPNFAKGTEADKALETIGIAVLQEMKNKRVLNLKNIYMVE